MKTINLAIISRILSTETSFIRFQRIARIEQVTNPFIHGFVVFPLLPLSIDKTDRNEPQQKIKNKLLVHLIVMMNLSVNCTLNIAYII